ncbi:MAG: phosphatidylglycerophosphatase A [Gammaproteobacteria bacterium]|nr:MAG: phosphatidylglycerophosphatase A [Gammaproteobacteria bacterium]
MSFNIKRNIVPRSVWRNPLHFIAFGFGSGALPYAPGTAGTLVAIPIYLLLAPLSIMAYALVTVAMFVAGVWICDRTSKDIGVHDHSGIVWDEIVGYLVTMFMAPAGWAWWVAGFVLFRLFDILKPFPIAALDRRVRGGLGIMVDDVLAAIYAALLLQIAVYTVT